jgi:hypothetical protein
MALWFSNNNNNNNNHLCTLKIDRCQSLCVSNSNGGKGDGKVGELRSHSIIWRLCEVGHQGLGSRNCWFPNVGCWVSCINFMWMGACWVWEKELEGVALMTSNNWLCWWLGGAWWEEQQRCEEKVYSRLVCGGESDEVKLRKRTFITSVALK